MLTVLRNITPQRNPVLKTLFGIPLVALCLQYDQKKTSCGLQPVLQGPATRPRYKAPAPLLPTLFPDLLMFRFPEMIL